MGKNKARDMRREALRSASMGQWSNARELTLIALDHLETITRAGGAAAADAETPVEAEASGPADSSAAGARDRAAGEGAGSDPAASPDASAASPARVKQCRSCPWRVGADPDSEIPNYSRALHEKLSSTIAEPGRFGAPGAVMACHYSAEGAEFPCAGWLAHQLGVGNNIALRLAVMAGRMPIPDVDGPQHQCFEHTLGLTTDAKQAIRQRLAEAEQRYEDARHCISCPHCKQRVHRSEWQTHLAAHDAERLEIEKRLDWAQDGEI